MSKKFKKMLSLICAVCLFVNLLMVHASGDMHMEMGTIEKSNRVPILTLTPGSGAGQVGYGGSEEFGYMGPDSFAVEDGAIYILDGLNNRIVVYQNGEYSDISIGECTYASSMKYQSGKIAIADNQSDMTIVYSTAGTQIAAISHPTEIAEQSVVKITEIGDTYVVWKTFAGVCYRYDWVTEAMTLDEELIILRKSDFSKNLLQVISSVTQREWYVQSEDRIVEALGECGDALIYEQHKYVPNVDMVFTELSVRRVDSNGNETFAIIDFSDWKAPASDPLYFSSDGKIYLMECLENSIVISEVSLGTADISYMGQLEKQAEARRAEVQAMEDNGDVSVCDIRNQTHTSSRKEAQDRAEEMIYYRWTVLANHKVESSTNADKITIPKCIMDATVGSRFMGIPYCWGGYNGLNDVGSYSSFANVVGLTNRTAGNIQDKYSGQQQGHVPYTIGIDCSGFVTSAYNMSGTKYGTNDLLLLGDSVAWDEIKTMDFIVRSGHTMLFVERNGNVFKTYEAFSHIDEETGIETGGKTMENQWTLIDLQDRGYTSRSFFHKGACNQNGGWVSTAGWQHAKTCSQCEYVWKSQAESHHLGNYTYDENGHYISCTVCSYSVSDLHTFEYYGECSVCGYIGEQVWP